MKFSAGATRHLLGDVGVVFSVSAALIVAFVAATAFSPDAVGQAAQVVLDATASNLGWMYLLSITAFWSAPHFDRTGGIADKA